MSRFQTTTAPAREMSVTDLAYTILKNRGQAMHYKDLIGVILQAKSISVENQGRVIAQIHTEINLDSRFFHKGHGEWGLRDWAPKPAVRPVKPHNGKPATVTKAPRVLFDYEDPEEEYRDRDDLDRDEYLEEDEDNLAPEPDPAQDFDGDEWE